MLKSFKKNIIASAIIIVLIGLMIFFHMIMYKSEHLIAVENVHTRQDMDIAYQVMVYYYNQSITGKMTKEQAQQTTKEIIRQMVYPDNGYYFMFDYNCNMLVIPVAPEMEGQNRCDANIRGNVDKDGKIIFKEFVEVAKSQEKSGYVRYYGLRPRMKNLEDRKEKISYIRGFDPWGWAIGNGYYLEDLHQDVKETGLYFGLMFGMFIMLILFLILVNVYPLIISSETLNKYINHLLKRNYNFDVIESKLKFFADCFEYIKIIKENKTKKSKEKALGFDKNFFNF